MHNGVIIGAQWGDEGKGKVVDLIAEEYDAIVRHHGGDNAGHTVVFGGKTYKMHLLPSGIFRSNKQCFLTNGMVINPPALLKEIEGSGLTGLEGRLFISPNAHLVMFYHQMAERFSSRSKAIGTTGKGIGPAYMDKMERSGLRIGDLLKPEILAKKIEKNFQEYRLMLTSVYGADSKEMIAYLKKEFPQFTAGEKLGAEVVDYYAACGERLRPYIADTPLLLNRIDKEGKKILFEGAHGVLLDIDHGTYPYVTSSNCTFGSVFTGSGFSGDLERRIGVVKAYTTRVGAGPFPTELDNEIGELIRKHGAEYGTTTGRPRRCGWLDTVLLKYSNMLNRYTELAVTKLDVLDAFDEIDICISYKLPDGTFTDQFPTDLDVLAKCKPICLKMPGWQEDISKCTSYVDLPYRTKQYLDQIVATVGVPISYACVGPDRNQTLEPIRL